MKGAETGHLRVGDLVWLLSAGGREQGRVYTIVEGPLTGPEVTVDRGCVARVRVRALTDWHGTPHPENDEAAWAWMDTAWVEKLTDVEIERYRRSVHDTTSQ